MVVNLIRSTLIIGITSLFLAYSTIADGQTNLLNYHLFKIDRSKDKNVVLYDINLTETGQLHSKKPITYYWVKNEKKGNIEALTWIQKKYAYGLNYIAITNEFATFQFVSYDKLTFTLKKANDKKYHIFTKFDDVLVKIKYVFVQIDGGTFWIPNVTEVKIYATEVKTGKETIKTIYP
jgi:hypothetical protein